MRQQPYLGISANEEVLVLSRFEVFKCLSDRQEDGLRDFSLASSERGDGVEDLLHEDEARVYEAVSRALPRSGGGRDNNPQVKGDAKEGGREKGARGRGAGKSQEGKGEGAETQVQEKQAPGQFKVMAGAGPHPPQRGGGREKDKSARDT
eukprot:6488840-Amphidinium_carterae.2